MAFCLGQLPAADCDEIAGHTEVCPPCQTQLSAWDETSDPLLALLKGDGMPAVFPFVDEPEFARALSAARCYSTTITLPFAPANVAPPEPLELREYKLLDKLGEGGMGSVYRAVHTKLDKLVAVKLLRSDRLQDPQAVARFEREMKAVGKLEHPHLIRAHDAGEVRGMHFLVMEFVAGDDLAALVKRHGPLPVAEACELVRQAAVGLQHAHEHGLVHRDVKPNNLILSSRSPPTVKVLDLGLALLQDQPNVGGEITSVNQVMGTLDYMAPEQATSSHAVDIRADIYSLGATLYKLLTGVAPLGVPAHEPLGRRLIALATQPHRSASAVRPDLPPALVALLDRLLAKEPAARPATSAAVAESLKPFAAGADLASLTGPELRGDRPAVLTPTTTTASAVTQDFSPHRGQRWSWSLLAGSLLAVAVASAAVYFSATPSNDTGKLSPVVAAVPVLPQVDDQIVKTSEPVEAATGELFPPGKTFDVLALADVDRHVIASQWKRNEAQSGVTRVYGKFGRLIVPVQVVGDYELTGSFTRLGGDGAVTFCLPLGPDACCSLVLSDEHGAASGLAEVGGFRLRDQTTSAAVVRPGRLVNYQRYAVRIHVALQDGDATVDVSLDGQPYLHWQGPRSSPRPAHELPLPRTDLLGLSAVDPVAFHELHLKPLGQAARLWHVDQPDVAAEPPPELRNACVAWKDHAYWLSNAQMTFRDALALAQRHRARLLHISSHAEQDFILKQWSMQHIWLGIWRDDRVADPKRGWVDQQLRPLPLVRWSPGEPSSAHEHELYASIHPLENSWHDVNANDRMRVCLEWGPEDGAVPDANDVVTRPPSPAEYRLVTEGLNDNGFIDPISWRGAWAEKGVFARARGSGSVTYPPLRGYSYALNLDLTILDNQGKLTVVLGDFSDAYLQLTFDSGSSGEIIIRLNNWLNGEHWSWGQAKAKVGERLPLTLLVDDGVCSVLSGGNCLLKGHGPPADPQLLIASTSEDLNAVIHSCRFRPLRESDRPLMEWKTPPPAADVDPAAAQARWEALLANLPDLPEPGKPFRIATTVTPLVWVEPSSFPTGIAADKKPRIVQLTRGYWIGRCEVTQREWLSLMETNPSRITGSPWLPVDHVSYDDALMFCERLTERERAAGRVPKDYEYRLPTEAEWECALRTGQPELPTTAMNQVWCFQSAGRRSHEVAESPANAWGLFDMLGNVPEWCLDAWNGTKDAAALGTTDPLLLVRNWNQRRVVRGGGFHNQFHELPQRMSHYSVPGGYRGFRLVLGRAWTHQLPAWLRASPEVISAREFSPQPPPDDWPAAGEPIAAEQALRTNTWYELLPLVDAARFSICGPWRRDERSQLHATAAPDSRVVVPLCVQGDYELAFAFTRYSGDEALHVYLPVGPADSCSLVLSGWNGSISGLGRVSNLPLDQQPASAAVRRPGALVNGRKYHGLIRVTTADDQATVAVQLDGEPYFTWTGPRSELQDLPFMSLPRADLLAFGVQRVWATIHEARLRLLSGTARRWIPEERATATRPPEAWLSKCVTWNERTYWISPEPLDRYFASRLAREHGARLIGIRSTEQIEFLNRQWPGKQIWHAGWRNGHEPDARIGWLDDRFHPLFLIAPWDDRQPDGAGDQSALYLSSRFHLLHDAPCDDSCYAVLEWSNK